MFPPSDTSNEPRNGNKSGSDRVTNITEQEMRARDIQRKLETDINEGISILARRLQELQTHRSNPWSDESGVSVITLAGNNSGATMNLGSVPGSNHRTPCGDINPEETGRVEDKKYVGKIGGKQKQSAVEAFVNSNVQSVNNSIVFDSSCSHRDPGVHLDLTSNAPFDGSANSGGPFDSISGIRITPKKKSWGKMVTKGRDSGKGFDRSGDSANRITNRMQLNRSSADNSVKRKSLRALFTESGAIDHSSNDKEM